MNTVMNTKPKIALTMGDPAGVGPEICLHALKAPEVNSICVPILFGDASILCRVADETGQSMELRTLSLATWADECEHLDTPTVVDLDFLLESSIQPATVSARSGQASFAYIEAAIRAAQAKQVAAVSTAPINKRALNLAGIHFPGHTEIFADRDGAKRWCMMQYSETITCTFVTVHCGYVDVPKLLTTERVLEVIELSAEGLRRIRGHSPRIVVCGLNPHAGEQSLFGEGEEERIITPAIESARSQGLQVEGPVPPDTAFLPWKRESTDVFVCMYHDQGHIPVKALAFDTAVNTTLGLSIVRTSVDHGTAFDIAWQGKANPGSLVCAIKLAVALAS
jgi:4-hydroxythreonine-4-phosphate dehydrogenase